MRKSFKTFVHPILLFTSYIFMVGAAFCIPSFILSFNEAGHTTITFGVASLLFLLISLISYRNVSRSQFSVSAQQLYLVTLSSWLALAIVGTIPLYIGLPNISFVDAFFEAMSGITTTGSTVLSGLDSMPQSMLLWRGVLQWIGGIGIIVLGVAVLPFLRVGGMRLFATESSDWSDKSLPKAQAFMQSIGAIYIGLTLFACICYWLAGMDLFDAVVHAMTSLATGGYSNHDASMGYFNDKPVILWLGSIFMLLGALPFSLYVLFLHGKKEHLLRDMQVRGFLTFVLIVIVLFSFERAIISDLPVFQIVTHVAFNVISIITTTGYASDDYTRWGAYSSVIFFYIMFIGGCSGSTSGAAKFFRFQMAFMILRNHLHLMRHPHAIYPLRFNGKNIPDDITRSIVAFSFFFAITIAVLALALSLTGLDFDTSLSAAATAVTNVGPGIGSIVGPAGNFSSLSDTAKWLLCIGMLVGRLEVMTVIVIFSRTFWKV